MTDTGNRLKICSIRLDGATQTRAELNKAVFQEYASAMQDGATFPPVIIFDDGENRWLADGFHRIQAARLAGQEEIAADVRKGTLRDAQLFSVGANLTHGLRPSIADKRAAVSKLLADPEWSRWSDREIARRAGVSQPFVSKMRARQGDNVITWIPSPGHSSTTEVDGLLAIVMPSDSDGFFYVLVIRPDEMPQANVEGIRKPIRADMVSRLLHDMGFPVGRATWRTARVGDDPDGDEGLDLDNRWTWPHMLYESRQVWTETRWRHDDHTC